MYIYYNGHSESVSFIFSIFIILLGTYPPQTHKSDRFETRKTFELYPLILNWVTDFNRNTAKSIFLIK